MTTPPGDQPPYGEPQHGDSPYGGPPYGEPGQPAQQPPYQQPGQQPTQPLYQQQYQQPYGQPYPPYGGYPMPPDHPKATTAMVLGILGLVMCQIVSPFAWSIGKRTLAEIDASGGRIGGRGQAQTGYILGIVGTVLLGLAIAFLGVYFVIVMIAIIASSAS